MWFFYSKAASPSLGCIVTRCNNNFLWLLYWSDLKLSTIWLALEHEHVYMVSFGGCVCVRYTYGSAQSPCLWISPCTPNQSWVLSELRGTQVHRKEVLIISKDLLCHCPLRLYVHVLLRNLSGAGARHVAISQFLSGKLGAHYQWPL